MTTEAEREAQVRARVSAQVRRFLAAPRPQRQPAAPVSRAVTDSQRYRNLVLAHYGRSCACCGTTARLEIDHVNGGGTEHHRALGSAAGPLKVFAGQDREGIEKLWEKATVEERRSYAQALIDYIVVLPAGRGRPKGSGVGMKRGEGGYFKNPMETVKLHWRSESSGGEGEASDGGGDVPPAGSHGSDPG
jgi:hypothetical protein